MNPAILLYLGQFMQILQEVPALIAAGTSVAGIISTGRTAIANMVAENRAPTDAEWAALDTQAASLHTQLQAVKP